MKANAIGNTHALKAATVLLAFTIGAVPGALAEGGSGNSAPVPEAIISHLELAGGSAGRMGIVKKDGKRLLYIEDRAAKVVRVVDVTTPEQPGALERSGATQRIPRLSAAVPLANSPGIFELLNSIGSKGQQGHLFSAAATFLADARHSLIFVVDEDGLWIVKAKQSVGDYVAPYDNADYETVYGG